MKTSRTWACVCGGSPAQTWWGGSVGGAARGSRGNGSCCPAEVAGGHSIGIVITHLLAIGDRRGAKRAIMAVAHRLLIIVYQVIARREPSRELGADYLDRQRPAATADHLLRRLRQLGVEVQMLASASADDTAIVAT